MRQSARGGRYKRCSVVTLDAKLLIARIGLLFSEGARASLRWIGDEVSQRDIVTKTSEERSNALLDQICFCLKDIGNGEVGENAVYTEDGTVTKWLVYVDFSSLFRNGGLGKRSDDKRETAFEAAARRLVEHGFSMQEQVNGQERTWHYSIFDKSSNQARNSIISFIADKGYGKNGVEPIHILDPGTSGNLNSRLCLDIDFTQFGSDWSKYFAYRGLYLSSSSRIDSPRFTLNERTVLVLGRLEGDVSESEIPKGVLRVENAAKGDALTWELRRVDGFRSKPKLFDGEGLVSPEYARIMRDRLCRQDATTFQIRMPFTKGLLHEVDFRSFLRTEIGLSGNARIKDAFGIERDLDDVQVVLTAEMFKCLKWLKLSGENRLATDDPMKYYFDRFHAHQHGLYVSGTDAGLDKSGETSLNGQFLSTLCMSQSAFDSFVRERMRHAIGALSDADAAREILFKESPRGNHREGPARVDAENGTTADYAPDDKSEGNGWEGDAEFDDPLFDVDWSLSGENEGSGGGHDKSGGNDAAPSWVRALKKSRRFLSDPYIEDEVTVAVGRKLLKCAIGSLDAQGTMLYLSHDLLRLLVEMARESRETSPLSGEERAGIDRSIGAIAPSCIEPDGFYAPSVPDNHENDGFFGLMRSPHLSRSEQCALQRHHDEGNLYQKYFGHLSGILMVSCESAAPIALGGADYDGDYVRVFWEDRVVKAVLDGAYERTESGSYRRRYPVVDMEGPRGAGDDGLNRIGEHVSFEQLRRTFSNHIGMISNSAMRKARDAYGTSGTEQDDDPKHPEEDDCAIYSVATGMEIDAVKSGEDITNRLEGIYVKPQSRMDKRERLGYISFKESGYATLTRMPQFLSGPYKVKRDRKANELRLQHKTAGQPAVFSAPNYADTREAISPSADSPISNIDRLPWLLLDELDGFFKGKVRGAHFDDLRDDPGERLFSFEEKTGWECGLDPHVLDGIERKLMSYRRVLAQKKRFEKKRDDLEARNDFAKACRILRTRPQAGDADRADGDARLRETLSRLREYFGMEYAPDIADVLNKLGSNDYTGWAFCPPSKREEYLDALMPRFLSEFASGSGEGDGFRELVLHNEQRDGYMILFYLLREVERDAMLGVDFTTDEPDEAVDGELFDSLAEIAGECLHERRPWTEWNNRTVEELRNHIASLLPEADDHPPELAKYLRTLQCGLNGRTPFFTTRSDEKKLFWSLLDWEDIDDYVVEDSPMSAPSKG